MAKKATVPSHPRQDLLQPASHADTVAEATLPLRGVPNRAPVNRRAGSSTVRRNPQRDAAPMRFSRG